MKVVALLPFWSQYPSLVHDVKCRPLANIGGKTLISRTVNTLNQIRLIKEVFVFASDDQIVEFIDKDVKHVFLKRDQSLDSDTISIENIIESFLKKTDADVVLLIHPKSPFIRSQTIQDCIEKVITGEFDSAFVAQSVKKHAWFKGERLNYSQSTDTPHLSELEPVLVETSSVYVFARKLFDKYRSRIGLNPYIKEVGHFEGFEVESLDDLQMAELIVNAGLDKEKN